MNEIIIENCKKKIKNKFDLVMLASKKTRELIAGNVKKKNDENNSEKYTLIALKEIEKQCLEENNIIQ